VVALVALAAVPALAALVLAPAVAVALQLAYQQRRRPGSGPPLVVALALAAALALVLALALALRRQTPAIPARPAQGRARAAAGGAAARPEPAQKATPRQRGAWRFACAAGRRARSPARRCCRPCCDRLFRAERASLLTAGVSMIVQGRESPQHRAVTAGLFLERRAPGPRSDR